MTTAAEKSVSFESLLGEHRLMGVAMVTRPVSDPEDSGNGIAFNLDNIAYVCWEDSNDGYRSSMGALMQVPVEDIRMLSQVAGQFGKGIPVLARMMPNDPGTWDGKNDVLEFVDTRNSEVILRVGTENTDDYYPSAIMNWLPERIATTHKGKK